mmetsp:Transcript_13601/g.29437  ORF Transcript_13601/g.29437 Transcript_13601/m.29437 type:complete len:96 (+) Transcript_13601:450-737(+)
MQAHHAIDSTHVELTPNTLPSNEEISLPQIRKAAKKLCDLVTSTIDEESIRTRYEELCAFDGPYDRPGGLAAFLSRLGFHPVLVDSDPKHGGGGG